MKRLVGYFATIFFISAAVAIAEEPPPHLSLARELLGSLSPDRNAYFMAGPRIVWPDEATGKAGVSNASVCSSFIAALLRKTYQLDATKMEAMFTEEWPEADEIFVGVSERREFTVIPSLKDTRPGDFLVIDYLSEKKIPTGHVILISGKPELVAKHARDRLPFTYHEEAIAKVPAAAEVGEWRVEVIDCSRSPHGAGDTRYHAEEGGKNDDGLGEGRIRLLANSDGKPLGYTWSTSTASKLWLVEDRPIVIARWK